MSKNESRTNIRNIFSDMAETVIDGANNISRMGEGFFGPDDLQGESQTENVILRHQLLEDREIIKKNRKQLNRFTQSPFSHGRIIRIESLTDQQLLEVKGTRVKIKSDSEFADQSQIEGSVEQLVKYGWVAVKFDDGLEFIYRTGQPDVENGICDLEIVEMPEKKSVCVTLAVDDKLHDVIVPGDLILAVGDTVAVNPQSLQPMHVIVPINYGGVGFVRRLVNNQYAEIDYESNICIVAVGRQTNLTKGDRVVLDSMGLMIIDNLGKDDGRFNFSEEVNVSWDDIAGLEEAKRELREAFEMSEKTQQLSNYYHKARIKGVLLFSPPGCGKTMLGKAIATSLAKRHQGDGAKSGFIYIKGPEILDRYVGVSEGTIRQVFANAREHEKLYGYPAVIFIDECDSILRQRGSGVSSDVENTLVPMFLAEMDGMEKSGAIIILATNQPSVLDTAVVRDKRIDLKIKLPRPTAETAPFYLGLFLKKVPLADGVKVDDLVSLATQEVFDEKYKLYEILARDGQKIYLTLGQIINGAMLANVVERASTYAMRRDEASGTRTGVKTEDIIMAIQHVFQQNFDINHNEAITELAHNFNQDIADIRKLQQTH